jgi:hypothetical protein
MRRFSAHLKVQRVSPTRAESPFSLVWPQARRAEVGSVAALTLQIFRANPSRGDHGDLKIGPLHNFSGEFPLPA